MTAVEWLINEISRDRVGQAIIKTFLEEFDQAKELEKQQIYYAFNNGYNNGCLDINKNAEQYYNETFKNK